MANHMHWAALLLSAFVACICDCKPIDGYKFPVYTTESCPRNQTEWSERSSAINCTESNGYLCLPNEDLTELLEFCYFDYQIPIAKGLCMFLRKRDSFIDDYSCRNFVERCPNSTYRIYEAYKYESCLSIGNGCFLDDPTCVSSRTTASVETLEKTKHERTDWVWIITLLGVIVLVFIPIVMYHIKIKASINGHNIVVDRSQTDSFNVDVNVCDEKGISPLYSACLEGHERMVNFLIANGADVNLCSKIGASPFCVACQNGHDSIVRLLLNNGADDKLCRKDGDTPFSAACRNGHSSIAKLLFNKDIDVNVCDEKGSSPLYGACFEGHESTVKFLIDNGADVNLCSKIGASPFYVACQNGHDSIVRLLLNNGADDKLCIKNGDTPFSAACRSGHSSIAQLLLNERVQK